VCTKCEILKVKMPIIFRGTVAVSLPREVKEGRDTGKTKEMTRLNYLKFVSPVSRAWYQGLIIEVSNNFLRFGHQLAERSSSTRCHLSRWSKVSLIVMFLETIFLRPEPLLPQHPTTSLGNVEEAILQGFQMGYQTVSSLPHTSFTLRVLRGRAGSWTRVSRTSV
jgi:hypothetical protein